MSKNTADICDYLRWRTVESTARNASSIVFVRPRAWARLLVRVLVIENRVQQCSEVDKCSTVCCRAREIELVNKVVEPVTRNTV
jgi:hypothetical protein